MSRVGPKAAANAFERALEVAARGRDTTAVADSLSALQKIVAVGSQPAGSLDSVVEVARERMRTADSAMVWQLAVELALATGDERLRAMVARVASGREEPSFSAQQQLRLWVRSAAQRALIRRPPSLH